MFNIKEIDIKEPFISITEPKYVEFEKQYCWNIYKPYNNIDKILKKL